MSLPVDITSADFNPVFEYANGGYSAANHFAANNPINIKTRSCLTRFRYGEHCSGDLQLSAVPAAKSISCVRPRF